MRDGARTSPVSSPPKTGEREAPADMARKAKGRVAPAPVHALPRPAPPPPRVRIDPADSPLERDADRLAENALGRPGSSAGTPPPLPPGSRAGSTPPPTLLLPLGGIPLPAPVRAEHEARFRHSFGDIRIHTGDRAAAAARSMEAEAFTVGRHIAFSRGSFAPHTAAGRHLLAHELAHVVQVDRGQVAHGVVQRRRVPAQSGLDAALPPATDPVALAAAREGMARALTRAWASLSSADRTAVRTAAAASVGITFTNAADLQLLLLATSRQQLLDFAALIRAAEPDRTLGDPALIDTGPRTATADAANIATLIANANAIFTEIASGTRDGDLRDVFGASHVAAAKRRYARAQRRIGVLNRKNRILTDRSGYGDEVGLGGFTNPDQLAISPETIDNPSDNESVITFIHESMHAGNSSVDDFGYIGQPSFKVLPARTKLNNAAHYEVVPRRILGAADSFPGEVFVPAGTTTGSHTEPTLTPREEALRGASEEYRGAWTAALNLHSLLVQVHLNPTQWDTLNLQAEFTGASRGARFSNTLPFWSQVMGLTIHGRLASINPAGTPAQQPVTLIDIALSEGLVRKLSAGMNGVPEDELDTTLFLSAFATPAEWAAATTVDLEKNLLIRLLVRHFTRQMTGTEDRDVQVVQRLAQANRAPDFSDTLQRRTSTATFP